MLAPIAGQLFPLGAMPRRRSTGPVPPSSMALWLKADAGALDASGNSCTNGVAVATWRDQSGNGYDATQATSAARPLFATGQLNSLPAITFNGSSQFLANGTISLSQPFTVATVHYRTSQGIIFSDAGGNDVYVIDYGGSAAYVYAAGAGFFTWTSGVWHTMENAFDGASSYLEIDGTQTSFSLGSSGGTGLKVGLGGAGNWPWGGSIAELLVYPWALSPAQLTNLNAYFNAKYGL